MKVLITGGAGFIGYHTTKKFIKEGWEVIIVDDLSRQGAENNLKILQEKYGEKIEFHKTDVYKSMQMDTIINHYKPEAIIHLAAQTAVTTSMRYPEHDFETNVIGTFNILEAVRTITKYDPKIIFASTNKVYGDFLRKYSNKCGNWDLHPDLYIVGENTRIDHTHHSPYGVSKLCADLYCQEYAYSYGLKVAIFRMSCIYGTHQHGIEDQGWVSHFVNSALKDKTINIFGDGNQVRDLLYVTDLVEAYYNYIMMDDSLTPLVFNMGGGENFTMSLLELINFLSEELDKPILLSFHKPRPADQQKYISDIDFPKNVLCWEPKIEPNEGVRKLIKWVKEEL